MTIQQKIISNKLGLLNLAEELGNVSKACKIMGLSRDTFYRYKELKEEGGIEALIDKSRRGPNRKNRVDEETERQVLAMSCVRKVFLFHQPGFEVCSSGIT